MTQEVVSMIKKFNKYYLLIKVYGRNFKTAKCNLNTVQSEVINIL